MVAVALPGQPNGRVWRLKGSIDTRVVREVGEADVGSTVVIVFKAADAVRRRSPTAATRGETAKAYAAKRFRITVS